jgi:surfactin synthase thioesterase subunit
MTLKMNQATPNLWITRSDMSVAPVLRLFCLPYAGGNAAVFNSWAAWLPKRVQLCALELPGRRRRFSEPAHQSLPLLVQDLTALLMKHVDLPYAVFGISFGALIGFELAHEMNKLGHPPIHLFVANCRAPHLPDQDPPIHVLSDSDLLTRIQLFGATPDAVFQHPELMKLMLPTLRADFKLAETYTYYPRQSFAFPITAFLGSEDPALTSEHLTPWREHTHGPYTLEVIRGNHYLVDTGREALLQSICSAMTGYLDTVLSSEAEKSL